MTPTQLTDFEPVITNVGLDGLVVRFGDRFSDAANRAAISFHATIAAQAWPEISESCSTLVSAFFRCDPVTIDLPMLKAKLAEILDTRDWYASTLPEGRKLWQVPVSMENAHAPQLDDVARKLGQSTTQIKSDITSHHVRVLTLGFAPGQPYLGELPAHLHIPRQTQITPQVPKGALVTAISQLILWAAPAPTGWWQIGQTAFSCYQPESETPFPLRSGDEVTFVEVSAAELDRIAQTDRTGSGGAEVSQL